MTEGGLKRDAEKTYWCRLFLFLKKKCCDVFGFAGELPLIISLAQFIRHQQKIKHTKS